MGIRAEPVHAALEQGKSSCSLGLHKSFSFAFFAFPASLGNEQPTIAERSHVIRQILMGFSLEDVIDSIRSTEFCHQTIGIGAGRTGIPTLVEMYMRVVLQKHAESFL